MRSGLRRVHIEGYYIEGQPESIRQGMKFYWSSKNSATVYDRGRHMTALTRLQRVSYRTDATRNNDKPDNPRRNSGPQGGNVGNVEARGPSSLPSSRALRLKQQRPAHLCQYGINSSRSHHSSILSHRQMTTIDYVPFCRLCPAANHRLTQFPAISSQFHAKLIKMREPNLQVLPTSTQWTSRTDTEDVPHQKAVIQH